MGDPLVPGLPRNLNHPDFRHTRLGYSLCLDSQHAWVEGKQRPGRSVGEHKLSCKPGFSHGREGRRMAVSERDSQRQPWSRLRKEGKLVEAVKVLELRVERGSYIDNSVFYEVLKRCMQQKDLVLGSRIHGLAVKSGYESNPFLASHFICMYASHGKLEKAVQVFSKVPTPSRYMWASIILAHARHGQPKQAIKFYRQMQESTVEPDNHIFVAVLKACAAAEDLCAGREIHARILGTVEKSNIFVGNCLVDMYAKCGSLGDARRVFDNLPKRDVVTWTAMIGGYAKHGLGQEALSLYASMQQEGITPANHITFVCLLQACASTTCLHQGQQLHAQIRARGLETDVVVGTSLVDMYSKCGSLEDARRAFESLPTKNVVTWNAMITGYAQHGFGHEALSLYETMQQEGSISPNAVTFLSLLQACASIGALQKGKQLHAQIQDRGVDTDIVTGTALVDMYAKCGSLEDARRVFDKLQIKNVVTWTAMIAGYAQHGFGEEALHLYGLMQHKGMTPANAVTFVYLLQACGRVAALEKGKEIHAQISCIRIEATDIFVVNALVDMYGKCGSMVDAQQVFDASPTKDIVTWNALISGYARQGESEFVFDLFQRMRQDGIQPDSLTLLSIITVCSHAGLVEKGWSYFEAMRETYGITPVKEHYSCMADLLGRAGQVDKAMEMVTTMPFQPDGAVWRCLLGACQKWKNVEVGRQAFECAVKLDKDDAAAYVLMANTYASAQMQEGAREIRAMQMKTGARKRPGQSRWTDSSGTVHTFVVEDRDHPEWQDIDAKLKELLIKMKKEGYVPHLDSVLRDIPDDEKEAALCGHSEKLAIAYALHKTPAGATIRVVKNLRVCEDCHTATAIISKIEQRTIICRDASRFHVYKDGKCSCGDYW